MQTFLHSFTGCSHRNWCCNAGRRVRGLSDAELGALLEQLLSSKGGFPAQLLGGVPGPAAASPPVPIPMPRAGPAAIAAPPLPAPPAEPSRPTLSDTVSMQRGGSLAAATSEDGEDAAGSLAAALLGGQDADLTISLMQRYLEQSAAAAGAQASAMLDDADPVALARLVAVGVVVVVVVGITAVVLPLSRLLWGRGVEQEGAAASAGIPGGAGGARGSADPRSRAWSAAGKEEAGAGGDSSSSFLASLATLFSSKLEATEGSGAGDLAHGAAQTSQEVEAAIAVAAAAASNSAPPPPPPLPGVRGDGVPERLGAGSELLWRRREAEPAAQQSAPEGVLWVRREGREGTGGAGGNGAMDRAGGLLSAAEEALAVPPLSAKGVAWRGQGEQQDLWRMPLEDLRRWNAEAGLAGSPAMARSGGEWQQEDVVRAAGARGGVDSAEGEGSMPEAEGVDDAAEDMVHSMHESQVAEELLVQQLSREGGRLVTTGGSGGRRQTAMDNAEPPSFTGAVRRLLRRRG